MKTIVEITWDEPEYEEWLCPDNIKLALSSYCTNTKFEVKQIPPLSNENITIEIVARFLLNPHPNQRKNYDREKIAFANGAKFARDFYEGKQSNESPEKLNNKTVKG